MAYCVSCSWKRYFLGVGWGSAKSVYFLWPHTWIGVFTHSACFPAAPRPQAIPPVVRKPASMQVLERGVQQSVQQTNPPHPRVSFMLQWLLDAINLEEYHLMLWTVDLRVMLYASSPISKTLIRSQVKNTWSTTACLIICMRGKFSVSTMQQWNLQCPYFSVLPGSLWYRH